MPDVPLATEAVLPAVLGFTLFPAFLMFSMSVDTHASAGKRSLLPTDLTLDLLRGFVAAVPKEIEEAAYVDGASWSRMFWSILMPLVAPGLVAVSVFSFIIAWNEFIFALTFNTEGNPDLFTASIGLRRFFGEYGNDRGAIMAGSTLITVPVMLFFVVVQRRMSSGLVAGAVKG